MMISASLNTGILEWQLDTSSNEIQVYPDMQQPGIPALAILVYYLFFIYPACRLIS